MRTQPYSSAWMWRYPSILPALSLLVCLLVMGSGLFQGSLAATKGAKAPKLSRASRDFLPPVASINGPLSALQQGEAGEDLGPITLSAVHTPPTVKVSQPVMKLDSDLGIKTTTDEYQELLKTQKALDEEDLRVLWDATVEKNPVIRFSLEKLSTPADLQPKKSSQFLNKTINVLISGATIAATMAPGGGYYRNMGAMAGGDALRNVLTNNNKGPLQSLTPTEQIQLAGLVDELQSKLVQTYHDYKNTLQALGTAHEQAIQSNSIYSQALQSKNNLAILAAGTAYYKASLNETELKQKAKMSRLRLERLAGEETIAKLRLSVTISKDITASEPKQPVNLIKPETITVPQSSPGATPETKATPGKSQAVALPPEPDRISP